MTPVSLRGLCGNLLLLRAVIGILKEVNPLYTFADLIITDHVITDHVNATNAQATLARHPRIIRINRIMRSANLLHHRPCWNLPRLDAGDLAGRTIDCGRISVILARRDHPAETTQLPANDMPMSSYINECGRDNTSRCEHAARGDRGTVRVWVRRGLHVGFGS